jgi:hypothetical protein
MKTFTKVWSVLLRAVHKRVPLGAFPHFSLCASGQDLNITEYFIHLFHYRSCFCVFVCDGMTLRFQRFCVQYFRNPDTGTSTILVYAQVRWLFCCFAQHCAHSRPGGKLRRYRLRQTGFGRPADVSFSSPNPIETWCSCLTVNSVNHSSSASQLSLSHSADSCWPPLT